MWAFGLCVAALAATACSGWDLKSEYHYKTEAKMFQELDKKIHQHSGFMGSSNLILQFKENSVLVKIQNPKVHAVNERPDPDHDHAHHYESPPPEMEHEIAKPFRINYDHDVLTSIDVSKDEPVWSVNAKKAIAARFQLENINSKNASERNFYTRSEDGPNGECEVDYVIDKDTKHHEIYVTKTKNFEKCKSISYRYYDNQNLWNCFEGANALHQPLQMSETTYIDVTGDRENYYVHWQRMEESFTYAPYGLDADYIKGSTKLEITLTSIEPLTEEIHIPEDAVTHHSLHSEFQHADEIKSVEDLKNHPYGFYYFLGRKNTVEKVAEMFERLMTADDGKKYTEAFNKKPMPFLFMQVIFAMTALNYDELKDLHENHVNKEGNPGEDMRIRKQVFGDALVATGTSSAFMYLKDCMTSGKVPNPVINHLLKQIPMSLQPISQPLLEEFYELCKDPHIHDNVENRKVCYLAFSTVVHEQCVSRYHKVQERYIPTEKIHCTPVIAERFFEKILAEPEAHAQDSFTRVLLIKVAGNFGTRGSLVELLKIIHDDDIHQYYKFNAIMSLEHHASLYPEEVLHAMLPLYYSTEPQEIRMAAFLYILFSEPEMHHLEAIAENLKFEHDHQVAHYVMSSIEQLSHLESPCYTELILMCKRASRFFDRLEFKTNFDFRHSFGWYDDGFSRKFQIGGQTNMNYITSNQSYVPQHVYLYFMDYVGHTYKSPLEIGYNGYGLDKVIDNFFGIPRVKEQAPTVEKELKEFDEKLHIEVREHEPMLADFYVNSFGSTIDFFHFNDTTFEKLAERDAGQLPALLESMKDIGERSHKRFYMGRQQKLTMPTSLGWPFCVDSMEINFAHYRNNQFKLHVDPNLLTGAKNDEAPPTVNVKIDAHIVHDRMSFAAMGTALPAMHVSTSAGAVEREYCSLPLKLKIALDPKTPKLVVKYTPILPHTRLHMSFIPVTVLHNMSNPDFAITDAGFLPYHHKKHELVKVDEDYFHDYIGYGININGSTGHSLILDSWGSFKKFLLENDLRTKLYYLEHNPMAVAYDYEVSLTPASKDQANEIDMEFTLDHWGFDTNSDKSHKPPLPVIKDGHEDYIDSRDDRKARTCVAKVDVVSKGAKERKLHMGLAYTHTFDDRYHQVNFNYDRSPFGPEETDHYKICYRASVMYPHVDMQKMYHLDTVDMHPKIEVAEDMHFGKNCENDKKITMRATMVRTEEHQEQQADRENVDAAPYNLDAKLYQRCKKSIENGHRYSRSCRYYWYRSLKLRDYKMDFEFENLDAHDKEGLEHLESCVEHYLHYYMTKHHHEVEHNPNKVHVDANFSATTDHVDIRITKSDETVEFDHVPHPHDVQARSATPFFEFTNKMVAWNYYKFPFCAVEGDKVHTFDDVHYDIPPMDCYKVIAKDCSEKKIFTILDRKVTNNRFHKAIKVFLGNWLIEALPVSADSDIIVRINGEHIPVTEEKPHYHYQKHHDVDHLMFTVSYDGLFYKIRSHKYGVIVYYDGNAAVVNLSPYYRGKQCGLCGDFNNNDHLEFQGSNNCYYKNATDFSYSYAIPGDHCHVPEIVAPCEHHDSENIINSKNVL